MSAHSPLPWSIDPLSIGTPWAIDAANGDQVCQTDQLVGDGLGSPQRLANAEFIVRACNAHDELLAACKVAEDYVLHHLNAPMGTRLVQRKAAIAALRAAIAKAEGR